VKLILLSLLVVSVAVSASGQTYPFDVVGLSPNRHPVPLTTQARIVVGAWAPPTCLVSAPPATVTGRTVDITFVVGGICGGPGVVTATSIDLGYVPAGTYTVRRITLSRDGTILETLSFTFEVIEAGAPIVIPTLGKTYLAMVGLVLLAAGARAIQ
jgi:hypothetical protein